MPCSSKKFTDSCNVLDQKWREQSFDLKNWRNLSYVWNHSICSVALVIFKETYSMYCFRRKLKATSVGLERLQKTFMRMKSQYLFSGNVDFQRSLQFHDCNVLGTNEDNIHWNWKVAEVSHAHENHSICSTELVIFKQTYSFLWCCKMESTSVGAERLQKPLMRMKSQYLFSGMVYFQRSLQFYDCGVLGAKWTQHLSELKDCIGPSCANQSICSTALLNCKEGDSVMWCSTVVVAKWRQHPLELKFCRSLSFSWNHSICWVVWLIFKEVYRFKWYFRRKWNHFLRCLLKTVLQP